MERIAASAVKALKQLTPAEKKEFLQVAKAKGTSVGQLMVDLLRGYVESNRILQ